MKSVLLNQINLSILFDERFHWQPLNLCLKQFFSMLICFVDCPELISIATNASVGLITK